MAEIHRFPILYHLRSDSTAYIVHYRRGRVINSGPALSMLFNTMTDSISEVPMDDQDLTLIIHARSSDFQDITAQGVLIYRAVSPEDLARRVDFTIDLRLGSWREQPLEKLEFTLSQIAQEHALHYVAAHSLKTLLADGGLPLRDAIERELRSTDALKEMGLELVTVRIGSIKPSADLEKAIEAPTRERIKQDADQAAFARRAMAVEHERAIAENEMHNRIELAKRETALLEQQGENSRMQAVYASETGRVSSDAKAQRIKTFEGVRTQVQRERVEFLKTVGPSTLLALAARDFAAKISSIEHFNVTPDLLALLKDGLSVPTRT